MKAEWTPYWFMLQDELPGLGSGLRHGFALIGTKWVKVKHTMDDQAERVVMGKWRKLHKEPDFGQPLDVVLRALK